VRDQRSADFGGRDARVQALRLEARVGLALAVDDVAQVAQQIRQPHLRGRAARAGATVEAFEPRAQLVLALSQRPLVPIERADRLVEDPAEQVADRARHEEPPLVAGQRRGSLLQNLRDIRRQLHAHESRSSRLIPIPYARSGHALCCDALTASTAEVSRRPGAAVVPLAS